MKNSYVKLFYLSFLCLLVPSFVDAYQFTKDIKLGDVSSDVFELQKILNSDVVTNVVSLGFGSKGQETNYFGNLTKSAVIRFQEKYKNEILFPSGLSFGTGYVGTATRKKLNTITNSNGSVGVNVNPLLSMSTTSIKDNQVVVTKNNPSNLASGTVSPESVFGPFAEKDVFITSISAFEVKSGEIISISAGGLLKDNIVHIGDSYTINANSLNGVIKISVPNIAKGVYLVWVENKNGRSKEVSSQYIKISDQTKVLPIISRSYPQNTSSKGYITVEGQGFDTENNTIYSTLGVLNGVSSKDGKIKFFVGDFSEIKKNSGNNLSDGGQVTYSVKSSNGKTSNFGVFTLSPSLTKNNQNIFSSFTSFVGKTIDSLYGTKKALAFVSRMHDGGTIGGVDRECTCSGSTLIKFSSYIDNMDYKYIYQFGVTDTYSNFNQTKQGEYFLATTFPYGLCMVVKGEYCENEGAPDGTLNTIGTS